MREKLSIFLIEEVRSMRERLAVVIESLDEVVLLGQCSNIDEVWDKISTLNPNIVILDIDLPGLDISKSLSKFLTINQEIGIICISSQWNEVTAKLVVKAGGKGYLAKPFTEEELAEALGTIEFANSTEKTGQKGKVVAFISPKGGCGKTTSAVNLAVALHQLSGTPIGMLDADLQFGDIPIFLDINPIVTIADAVRDFEYLTPDNFKKFLTSYKGVIKLLSAVAKPEQAELVLPQHIDNILARFTQAFRYCVVDTPAGLNEIVLTVAKTADIVCVLADCRRLSGIRGLHEMLDALSARGLEQEKIRVIITCTKGSSIEERKALEEELTYPITLLVPEDGLRVNEAINMGIPLVVKNSTRDIAKVYLLLAESIEGQVGGETLRNLADYH